MAMNTDTGIQVAVSAQNVPANVGHKTRDAEIEELPRYLRVNATAPENLQLINVQADTPGVNCRPYPWLKLDANGYPVANPIYVWNTIAGDWVNAAP